MLHSLAYVLPAAARLPDPDRAFAALRCPSCGKPEPLVAAKTKLGCESCLAKPAEPVTPPPPAKPVAAKPTEPTPAPSARTAPAGEPATKQQVLPPKVKAHAMSKAGEKLADEFWTAAARGSLALSRLLLPDSPAATLFRLYGARGPATLLGMKTAPMRHTATACPSRPEQPEAVSGQVKSGDYLYGYQITWRLDGRTALAEELLPNIHEPGRRFHPHWMVMKGIGSSTQGLATPRGLEPLERLIWKHSLPFAGCHSSCGCSPPGTASPTRPRCSSRTHRRRSRPRSTA